MTSDEILKALEESEGFYLEVGDWAVARLPDEPDATEPWMARRYANMAVDIEQLFFSLAEAIEHALKDGKP